jgi:hypothetical protein
MGLSSDFLNLVHAAFHFSLRTFTVWIAEIL